MDKGAFTEPAVEQAFQDKVRRARIPFVRAYAAITAFLMIDYVLINPLFFTAEETARFTLLLVPSLICLAAYAAVTFWKGYVRLPLIDWTAMLALAILVTGENVVLFDELNRQGDDLHGNVGINSLIVSAFAAFVLAGRFRWFLAWVLLHGAGFSALIFQLDPSTEVRFYEIFSHLTGAVVMLFLNWGFGRADRTAFLLNRELEAERAKTEELLYNVLPQNVAERLRAGKAVADSYSDVTVVFIDVVGFTQLATKVSPGHLVEMLNAFFGLADRCAAEHGVEKVKTIGDAYLAIAGGNIEAANSADAALAFAQAVIAGMDEVREKTGIPVQVRVGMHSGAAIGGVIGATRMAYDYWGETMNMASRIEGQAQPGGIAVSESTFLRTRRKELFALPEIVTLKGVGEAPVYRIKPAESQRLALAS